MRIVVLGAGVIGTTTAYFLAKSGHEVTAVDRQPGPGLETSFANAGEITPGYASPWAAPGVPLKAMKWMFGRHAPFKIRLPLDMNAIGWMSEMWKNCTSSRFAINTDRMIRISEYSRQTMAELRDETGIHYDQRLLGTLQLFRDASQLEKIDGHTSVLDKLAIPYEILDRAACERAEPGLAFSRGRIAGGIRLPLDETGDCFKFTTAIADKARAMGVKFLFDTPIDRLRVDGGIVTALVAGDVEIEADAFVAALGSYTPALLKPLGLNVPVYPLKGYSLTLPIVDPARAPVSTVLDDQYKVAITRLGDRIRIGGIAEIAGFTDDLPKARTETLDISVQSLFPGAGDADKGEYWTGLRPMTPDGTPIVGRTRYRNLFTNTGHGTFGWTMAAGSARVIDAVISGRSTDFGPSEFGLERYAS